MNYAWKQCGGGGGGGSSTRCHSGAGSMGGPAGIPHRMPGRT